MATLSWSCQIIHASLVLITVKFVHLKQRALHVGKASIWTQSLRAVYYAVIDVLRVQ